MKRRLALAACLLAAAGLLAAEERSVLEARGALEHDGARRALVLAGAAPAGSSSAIGGVERLLLGVEGLPDVGRALDNLAQASHARKPAARRLALAAARRALAAAVRADGPRAGRSTAANLLGVLLVTQGDAAAGAQAFRQALLLDSLNDAAKLNLELALPRAAARPSPQTPAQVATGSGSGRAGSGY